MKQRSNLSRLVLVPLPADAADGAVLLGEVGDLLRERALRGHLPALVAAHAQRA